jgi:heavy metal translocating P-type ATPase
MIVASPCAVVLATMPPLLSAIANAGRHGVLVKSAVVMEGLGSTTQVAFDKTGTLTEGTPRVAEVHALLAGGVSQAEVLRLAASAERHSEHPLARAMVTAAGVRGLQLAEATDFRSTPGRGVVAAVEGLRIEVGSPVLLDGHGGRRTVQARIAVTGLEEAGCTAVVVIVDGEPVGVVGLVDRLRPTARATVAALTALTGREPVLLTGDNARAAGRLGAEVGISDVRAGLLPQHKVAEVGRLHGDGERVLVVGDGVNDAPALAAADLGVAMGRQGSDLALQTADAVIVRDELDTLPTIIDLSRRARRVVIQNLVLASTIITVLVAWDLLGHLPLPLGVAGHEGSTVIVGLNGLRLLRRSAWRVRTLRRTGRL